MVSVAEFDSEDEMRRVIDRLDDQEFFGQRLRITQVQPHPPFIV
jgi:RNA recognition motif-containing protein